MYYKRIIFLSITILYIIVMEKSLRERQIREILDEDILINKRVSELTRLRIRGLTDEGQAIQQGRRNADIESKTSDTISKINGLLETKINDGLALSLGPGKGNAKISHYLSIFNNSNLINLYNSVVNEYRKGKNSIQTTAIIQAQFQSLDNNISKLLNVLKSVINSETKKLEYLPREILSYSIYDLIQADIYTNNFSTITEKDIMANLYKVISKEAAWKTDIENIQANNKNKNIFKLNEDNVNLITEITDQQKLKQDELLTEKANKAKVGNMDVLNTREIYKNKIEELENDFNAYLLTQQPALEAASLQYNNNIIIPINNIKPLNKNLTTLLNRINTINTTRRRDFKMRLITFFDNAIAQTYIDTLKTKIMDFLQIFKRIVYVDAQQETDITDAITTIEPLQFDYSIPNPRNAADNAALAVLIDNCFDDIVTALTAIYRNSKDYYDIIEPIYNDIVKEKKEADKEISKLNKALT